MGNFFEGIYLFFEDMIPYDIQNYIWPQSPIISQDNICGEIGVVMLAISLFWAIVCVLARKRICAKVILMWLTCLIINAVINFVLGWQWLLTDYYAGKMTIIDCCTNTLIPMNIEESDIINFGIVNMIISIIFYNIFVLVLFVIKKVVRVLISIVNNQIKKHN
jgi:hypothetical protein